jgi:hypothetical protein
LLDTRADRRIGDPTLACAEHDLVDVARLRRERLLQEILGALRLGSRKRELVRGACADTGVGGERRHEQQQQPRDQDATSVRDAPVREPHCGGHWVSSFWVIPLALTNVPALRGFAYTRAPETWPLLTERANGKPLPRAAGPSRGSRSTLWRWKKAPNEPASIATTEIAYQLLNEGRAIAALFDGFRGSQPPRLVRFLCGA